MERSARFRGCVYARCAMPQRNHPRYVASIWCRFALVDNQPIQVFCDRINSGESFASAASESLRYVAPRPAAYFSLGRGSSTTFVRAGCKETHGALFAITYFPFYNVVGLMVYFSAMASTYWSVYFVKVPSFPHYNISNSLVFNNLSV